MVPNRGQMTPQLNKTEFLHFSFNSSGWWLSKQDAEVDGISLPLWKLGFSYSPRRTCCISFHKCLKPFQVLGFSLQIKVQVLKTVAVSKYKAKK